MKVANLQRLVLLLMLTVAVLVFLLLLGFLRSRGIEWDVSVIGAACPTLVLWMGGLLSFAAVVGRNI